jgi:NADH-quinone oxidoreductase subunit H
VSLAQVVVTLVEIAVVLGFLVNMAALSVWADRRQSAMVQDRVGPNRAVAYVPSGVVGAIIFGVAALVAAAVDIPFWRPAPGLEAARTTIGLELAILVGWFGLMLLSAHVRRSEPENGFDRAVASIEPRAYFYGGLVLHLLVIVLMRLIPADVLVGDDGVTPWGPRVAGTLFAVTMMSAGLYAAGKLPEGRTPIRLAGTLHGVADALKLLWKEDLRPKNADKLLFALAPLLAMFPALVTFAVIPFGPTLCFHDGGTRGVLDFGDLLRMVGTVPATGQCPANALPLSLQIADLNVGLLYVFAIAGTGIIGAAIAGWASDNKFALLGGLRATSQMVSYEVAMGLAITGMLMVTSTVHLGKLVDWQGENAWGIFVQPLGFVLFFAALLAETKRVPFDQPEGESEIVAGYFLEYSGMKFGLFFLGEYAEFVFSSALLVTLFFGGYHLPFLHPDGLRVAFGDFVLFETKMSHMAVSVVGVLTFFGKTILLTWLQVFIRWTLPRFRYDQLMRLGWTRLLPLAIANILATGVLVLFLGSAGPGVQKALRIAADVTQGLVAIGGIVAAVACITWLLEPAERRRTVLGSSARYAAARGGVRPTEMQP